MQWYIIYVCLSVSTREYVFMHVHVRSSVDSCSIRCPLESIQIGGLFETNTQIHTYIHEQRHSKPEVGESSHKKNEKDRQTHRPTDGIYNLCLSVSTREYVFMHVH